MLPAQYFITLMGEEAADGYRASESADDSSGRDERAGDRPDDIAESDPLKAGQDIVDRIDNAV